VDTVKEFRHSGIACVLLTVTTEVEAEAAAEAVVAEAAVVVTAEVGESQCRRRPVGIDTEGLES
jgi:hypothetical protein